LPGESGRLHRRLAEFAASELATSLVEMSTPSIFPLLTETITQALKALNYLQPVAAIGSRLMSTEITRSKMTFTYAKLS